MRDLHQNPIRVGLVGLGGHGLTIQTAAAEAVGVQVVGVYDLDESLAREAEARFRCEAAASYDELIQWDHLEGVCLVTPNRLHLAQAEAAFSRGLHVFVEKPLANSVSDGAAIIRGAERAGRRLMVGHNMRFGRAPELARQLLQDERLGDVVSIELHFSADNTHRLDPSAWRLRPDECPLLPVMQLGIHGIDLVHHFLGPIEAVHAFARSVTTHPDVVDSVSASFRLDSGVSGTMVSNYCSQISFEYRIAGTAASLRGTPHRLSFRLNSDTDGHGDGPAEEHDFTEFDRESYRRQLEVFAEAIVTGDELHPDGWDGLRALSVVEALQRSIESGEVAAVGEFIPQEAP